LRACGPQAFRPTPNLSAPAARKKLTSGVC
jgi:hypothetical protein